MAHFTWKPGAVRWEPHQLPCHKIPQTLTFKNATSDPHPVTVDVVMDPRLNPQPASFTLGPGATQDVQIDPPEVGTYDGSTTHVHSCPLCGQPLEQPIRVRRLDVACLAYGMSYEAMGFAASEEILQDADPVIIIQQ